MTMTYDGVLVMPSSYAVMDEDEMCYLEGGVPRNVNWIVYPIDFVCTCIGLNASAIAGCAAGVIAKWAAKKWAVVAASSVIQNLLGAAGVSVITGVIQRATGNNKVLSLITRCLSFGGIIGLMVDCNDGSIDGKFNSPI